MAWVEGSWKVKEILNATPFPPPQAEDAPPPAVKEEEEGGDALWDAMETVCGRKRAPKRKNLGP